MSEVAVPDWNVVINVVEGRFRTAREVFRELGPTSGTPFLNVMVMKVADIRPLLATLAEWCSLNPQILSCVSRIAPAANVFDFATTAAFEEKAREVVLRLVPELVGKGFHVRMHRRGHKGVLNSHEEERLLNHVLLDALQVAGTPGSLAFDDPDAIIAIDTVGDRAGVSLWKREELQRYPFLKAD
jgi:tRNA(Ser,Leu) C12 N-acetylase TAN1